MFGTFYAFERIYIDLNGPILKNNQAICGHTDVKYSNGGLN